MKLFRIFWSTGGNSECEDLVDANNLDEALDIAHERCAQDYEDHRWADAEEVKT